MKVYYFADLDEPDLEYGADDWDELTLFINPDDEFHPNSKIITLNPQFDGWSRVNSQMNISKWPYELTERAKQRFFEACFLP